MATLLQVLTKYANDPVFPDHVAFNINALTYDGDSLLHLVAFRNDVEAARVLIDNGVEVNFLGDMGQTPLHEAVRHHDVQIAQLLLAAGADPFIVSEFGKDCIAQVRFFGNENAVQLLQALRR